MTLMDSHEVPSPASIIDQLRQRSTYVGSTEVMTILGVSRKTLCDWINSGKLPAIRLGKNNVCDPVVLSQWLLDRRTC